MHWQDPEVQDRLNTWMRADRAGHDKQGAKFPRFVDNLRQIAVPGGEDSSLRDPRQPSRQPLQGRRPRPVGRRRQYAAIAILAADRRGASFARPPWQGGPRPSRVCGGRSRVPAGVACRLDFETAGVAWIPAGGARRTACCRAVPGARREDDANRAGRAGAVSHADLRWAGSRQALRNHDVYDCLRIRLAG